jgi:hypothetical protein
MFAPYCTHVWYSRGTPEKGAGKLGERMEI